MWLIKIAKLLKKRIYFVYLLIFKFMNLRCLIYTVTEPLATLCYEKVHKYGGNTSAIETLLLHGSLKRQKFQPEVPG